MNQQEFSAFVEEELNKYKISESYNGFYDNRYLNEFELQEVEGLEQALDFSECYGREQVDRIGRLYANKADLKLLKEIQRGQLQTKYFEFDGRKYQRKEAGKLIPGLEKEISKQEEAEKELDKSSFRFNYLQAKKRERERERERKRAA